MSLFDPFFILYGLVVLLCSISKKIRNKLTIREMMGVSNLRVIWLGLSNNSKSTDLFMSDCIGPGSEKREKNFSRKASKYLGNLRRLKRQPLLQHWAPKSGAAPMRGKAIICKAMQEVLLRRPIYTHAHLMSIKQSTQNF